MSQKAVQVIFGKLQIERGAAWLESAVVEGQRVGLVQVTDPNFVRLVIRSVPPSIGSVRIYDDDARIEGAIFQKVGATPIVLEVKSVSIMRGSVEYIVGPAEDLEPLTLSEESRSIAEANRVGRAYLCWLKSLKNHCLIAPAKSDFQDASRCFEIKGSELTNWIRDHVPADGQEDVLPSYILRTHFVGKFVSESREGEMVLRAAILKRISFDVGGTLYVPLTDWNLRS